VYNRNVQMVKDFEPSVFARTKLRSRFCSYDYGNFYYNFDLGAKKTRRYGYVRNRRRKYGYSFWS